MRFRQIHLDFHTSPHIEGIGSRFDKKRWQDTLLAAAVDSITVFSKCHHGWSYHPTKVGKMHPHLSYDLLRAQIDACKEVGIATPVYLSAGVDNVASEMHPGWREMNSKGAYTGWVVSPLQPGFHMMDFHSPYLDFLCAQIEEAVTLFPEADGIFLDIIGQNSDSCGPWAQKYMRENGLDATKDADRYEASRAALRTYFARTNAASRIHNANMPIFHNSGHISRGDYGAMHANSHLELESLPTGGWGYDHFPASAKYVVNTGMDFLGMTGKFHTSWGEFGGYKHPNALRYECAAMLAFGSKCSVGDQLHPNGELDESTYEIVGQAYREVREKEPWARDVLPVADIAVLSSESELHDHRNNAADDGASRILLEGHHLFVFVDRHMDFAPYKMLILPDNIFIDNVLQAKIDAFLAAGGKLLLTGESGLKRGPTGGGSGSTGFAFDLGLEYGGPSPFQPDYVLPGKDLRPDFVKRPLVMYTRSQRVKATSGQSLGDIYDPYFNRQYPTFCSHQHAPNREAPSGYDCGVAHGNILYLAHPVFSLYRGYGAVAYKQYALAAIRRLLGADATLEMSGLPSTARVSLMRQAAEKRVVLHVLYANTINRGGELHHSGGNVSAQGRSVEVIEELLELPATTATVRLPAATPVKRVTLEPQGTELAFVVGATSGVLKLEVPAFSCHQMVVLHEAA
ncbi:hypothetical protein DB346_09290 [Verrucomicrobia bacterium LW23]|nr:hypothetical protein DB346_09290 [Verrucomicrobia bacterium LW23]